MKISSQPAIVFTHDYVSHTYLPADIKRVIYRRIRPNDSTGMFHVLIELRQFIGHTDKNRWYLTGDELADLARLLEPYKIPVIKDDMSSSSAKNDPIPYHEWPTPFWDGVSVPVLT